MARPLAEHLPSFASSRAGGPPHRLTPLGGGKAAKPDGAKSQVAEAEERARQQAAEVARIEYDALRAAERQAFEERLATERSAWRAEIAERLTTRLDDAVRTMDAALADAVARVLAPFLDRAVRERAVAELVKTMARLKGERDVAIRITGPEDLLAALRGPLSLRGEPIDYVVGETADVSVTIGDTAVETRIAAWCDRLIAGLEGDADG